MPVDLEPSEWDLHTAVRRTSDTTFAADLDAGWQVGGGLNGGYLLGIIGGAVAETLGDKPHPLSVSAYYLSSSRPGPASVETRVLRRGGTTATVAAELVQDGRASISTLATFGDLTRLAGEVATTAQEPSLPPLEECVPGSLAPEEVRRKTPLIDRFDMRFDPACVGWTVGQPSGRGLMQAWFRLADGHAVDALGLLMVCDALPPVTFELGKPGWAPTLELTVHVRAVPQPGWLKVSHSTRNVAGGMFEEDCEVWDSAGRLVAQSRQLALQPQT